MRTPILNNRGLNTRAVHGGGQIDPSTKALKVPIYSSNTYAFKNLNEFFDSSSDAYSPQLDEFAYFYTRTANPTTNALEQKIASVIGCETALVTGSGMSAIAFAIIANYHKKTKILVSDSLYRSTHQLTTETLPKFDIKYDYTDFRHLANIETLLRQNNYSIVFFESPANPTLRCYDIKAIVDLVHSYDSEISIIFDNTFASPVCSSPLKLGVDYEIHSLSKYISGHGDALGGVIASNRSENLSVYRREYGETFGQVPSPFNSYLIMRGLKTIGLRVKKQSENAMEIAKHLENHPKIKRVYYPGLTSHPDHEIAKNQMNPFSGIVTFELNSLDKVTNLLDNKFQLIKLAMDLGDIQSLIEFPYIMTHYDLEWDLKDQIGITEELLRLSVGIEDKEDIMKDLDQALAKV
jgi:methionine-gamma-lyase